MEKSEVIERAQGEPLGTVSFIGHMAMEEPVELRRGCRVTETQVRR